MSSGDMLLGLGSKCMMLMLMKMVLVRLSHEMTCSSGHALSVKFKEINKARSPDWTVLGKGAVLSGKAGSMMQMSVVLHVGLQIRG